MVAGDMVVVGQANVGALEASAVPQGEAWAPEEEVVALYSRTVVALRR